MIPKIWFDEGEGVLRVVFRDKWTEQDIPEIFSQMKKHFNDKKNRWVLADLTGAAPQHYSKEFTRILAGEASAFPIQKVAILGANPALRMMARFILTVVRTKMSVEAEFCKSDSQALLWLKKTA